MSTQTKLKRLKSIDDKTKHLVAGHNRRINKKLGSCNLFQNIPIMIDSLCILYYFEIDYFAIIPTVGIELSNNKQSIINTIGGYRYGGAGSVIVSSTEKFNGKWSVRIDECASGRVTIGLSSSIKYQIEPVHYARDPHYAYNGYKGYKWSTSGCTAYGKQLRTNDILDIHLIIDGDNQQVMFYKNKENLGVAFDEIETGHDIKYRLAVSICTKGDKVSIIDFKTQ